MSQNDDRHGHGHGSGASFRHFLTNMDQPMPLPEKLAKLGQNLWRRVVLRQNCCGHHGEPGC